MFLLPFREPFGAVFTVEAGVGSAEPLFVAITWTKVTRCTQPTSPGVIMVAGRRPTNDGGAPSVTTWQGRLRLGLYAWLLLAIVVAKLTTVPRRSTVSGSCSTSGAWRCDRERF